jgi:hypothetical protein
VLGDLTDVRPQALWVVRLVTVVARQQLSLLGRRPANLAVPAAGAQPARADIGRRGCTVARAVVVRAAPRAHHQVVDVAQVVAHLARHVARKIERNRVQVLAANVYKTAQIL